MRRPAWTEHLGLLGCEAGLIIGASGGGCTTGLETPLPRSAQRVGRVITWNILLQVLTSAAEPAAGVEDGHGHGHRRTAHIAQLSSSRACPWSDHTQVV